MSTRGFHAFNKATKKSRNRRSGGSRVPWQSYIFAMEGGDTALVRLLAPEGDDFFEFAYHGFPQKHLCTQNVAGFDGKCVFCHYNEMDKEFRNKWYRAARTIALVADFRYFHYDNSGEKPTAHVCADVGPNPRKVKCRHCKSTNAELATRHFGGQKRWELTDDQLAQVKEVHNKLSLVCIAQSDPEDANSVCGEGIEVLGYECGNEKCKEVIITDRDLELHDVDEALEDEFECAKCGESNWLVPMLECESGEHDAVMGSIFDRPVEVTCSTTTRNTKSGERTSKSYNFDRNVADWSTLEENLENFGFDKEAIEKIATPDDLVKRFAPFRLDPSEYKDEAEYVEAVLKKQVEHINEKGGKVTMPDGWCDDDSGKKSTGRMPWQRRSRS